MDEKPLTITDIIDQHWCDRIMKECSSPDPETNHGKADGILEELLKSMRLNKTLKAYKDLEKWYS